MPQIWPPGLCQCCLALCSGLPLRFVDAKLYDIGAGTNEIRRFLIGRELVGS